MNHGRTTPFRLAIALSAITCLVAVHSARAQVSSGPIVPLKKVEFKTVNPLGGANCPSPARGKRGAAGYYASSDPARKAGVNCGASVRIPQGTSRQPIRAGQARGAQYQDPKGMSRARNTRGGDSRDTLNAYANAYR